MRGRVSRCLAALTLLLGVAAASESLALSYTIDPPGPVSSGNADTTVVLESASGGPTGFDTVAFSLRLEGGSERITEIYFSALVGPPQGAGFLLDPSLPVPTSVEIGAGFVPRIHFTFDSALATPVLYESFGEGTIAPVLASLSPFVPVDVSVFFASGAIATFHSGLVPTPEPSELALTLLAGLTGALLALAASRRRAPRAGRWPRAPR